MTETWRSAPLAGAAQGAPAWRQAPLAVPEAPAAQPAAPAPAEAPSVVGDMAKSLGSGVVEGLYGIAAMPGDLDNFARTIGHWAAEKKSGHPMPMPKRFGEGWLPTSEDLMKTNREVLGSDFGASYEPKTEAGKVTKTVGSFLPLAAGPAAGAKAFERAGMKAVTGEALKSGAKYGVAPALASEGAGEAAKVVAPPLEPAARTIAALATGGLAGLASGERRAAAAGRRAIKQSGRTIPEVQAELAGNDRLRLADVDPNAKQLLQGIVAQPGPGKAIATKAIEEHAAERVKAVKGAMDVGMGPSPDALAVLETLKARAKTNAKRGFGAALKGAAPVDVTPVIAKIDNLINPGIAKVAGKSGITQGVVDQELGRARAMLTNGRAQLTDADKLHAVQQELRTTAKALGKSASGQDRLAAQKLFAVREVLNKQIDGATGGKFKSAQKQFADDMGVEEAFEKGFDLFKNRGGITGVVEDSPSAWAKWLKNASYDERRALRVAVRAAADQAVGSVRNAALKGEQLVAPELNRDKLRIIMGHREADTMIKRIREEMKMAGTNADTIGNSQTEMRRQGVKATKVRDVFGASSGMDAPVGAGVAGLGGLAGGVEAAAAMTALKGGRAGINVIGRRSDLSRNKELAKLLTAVGKSRDRAVEALRKKTARNRALGGAVLPATEDAAQRSTGLRNYPKRRRLARPAR